MVEYLELLGKPPEEVMDAIALDNETCRICYTYDPRHKVENNDKRIIRIKKTIEGIEILVGSFQNPNNNSI